MQGLTPQTAIKVPGGRQNSKAVYRELDKLLGQNDGSYFIISETTISDKGTDYRVLYVETDESTKRQYWFDITETT